MTKTKSSLIAAAAFSLALAASARAQQDFSTPDVSAVLADAKGGLRDSLADKPIQYSLYVDQDGIDVLAQPRNGDDIDSIRLTQLLRGETVKVLGEKDVDHVHWYMVEVPRREYNEDSGTWQNTLGWVRGARTDQVTHQVINSFTSDVKVARPAPKDLPAGTCREAFVKAMENFQGVPYVWGGTSHRGVDCSGLIQTAMIESGCIKQAPPRTANDQYHASMRLAGSGDMKKGDLVFLAHPGSKVHHVIGFVGDDQVIEAPHTGAVVTISEMQRRLASAGSNNQIYFGSLLGD